LDTKDIAAKFIELYWRQCRPFQIGGETPGLILQQNTGKQAAIISKIVDSQQKSGASLFRLKQVTPDRWSDLITEVDQVVRTMPLWKLQTVGEERLDFLYENLDRGTRITLKAGVAYCLRAFYELIRDLIEGAWVRFVQKVNASRLGTVTDLGTFLFGEERASLEAYRPNLMDVQHGTCSTAVGTCRSSRRLTASFLGHGIRPISATTSSWPTRPAPRKIRLPGSREAPGCVGRAEPSPSGGIAIPAPGGGPAV
jgi:hypothetical protein